MQCSRRFSFPRTRLPKRRRGAVMIWFIVAMPVLLTLLCVVLEVSNLYLARTELTNALEAAAQAGVKNWAQNFTSTGGDTNNARMVANTYAKANTINGVPVDLTTLDPALNYSSGQACNQNACGSGVFVFGAVTGSTPKFTFNCCSIPQSCGVGTVLFDATSQGNLNSGNNNDWGIRFQNQAFVPASLLISEITITLTGGTTFDPSSFALADNNPPFKVVDSSSNVAPDIFGLDPGQISVSFQSGNTVLKFTFSSMGADLGFEKGDRFRFGVPVNQGTSQISGDEIGQPGTAALVRVTFSNSATATGSFVDTQNGGKIGPPPPDAPCAKIGIYDAAHQSLSVFPRPNLIPDLPCAPTSAPKNDGQSFVQVSAGGGGGFQNAFAVRAQATYPVQSLCHRLFGLSVGPFKVTANADAVYSCGTPYPRLYHLEQSNFTCNVNCP